MIASVHPLPALGTGLALFNLATFAILVAPLLPDWLGWVLAFGLTEGAFVIAAVRLMSSKPKAIPKEVESPPEGEDRVELYCEFCGIYVHPGTKHCGKCHCCIDGFDHHCKWLNTCIGRRNYRLFIGLLVALLLTTLLLIASEVVVLQEELELAVFLIVLVNSLSNCVILGFISGLLLFHAYLKAKGMTTYDFVTRRRVRSKARESARSLQKPSRVAPELSVPAQVATETK